MEQLKTKSKMTFEEKLKKANAYLWSKYGETLFEEDVTINSVKHKHYIFHDEEEGTLIVEFGISSFKHIEHIDGDVEMNSSAKLPNLQTIDGGAMIFAFAEAPNLKYIKEDEKFIDKLAIVPQMIPNPNGSGYIRKDLLNNNENK